MVCRAMCDLAFWHLSSVLYLSEIEEDGAQERAVELSRQ
jgi:hypothetical protein